MVEIQDSRYIFYFMFYASAAISSFSACIYLLFRRGNAFSEDIIPPRRLRLWGAAFFASMALSHVWWFVLYYMNLIGDPLLSPIICILLDVLTTVPTMMGTLYAMLQDRRRPFWPILVAMMIAMVYLLICLVFRIDFYPYTTNNFTVTLPLSFVLPIFVMFTMVRGVLQYRRWLRDNYADLEHKEVGQSIFVMSAFLVCIIAYIFESDINVISYIVQTADLVLIFAMLWRLETLQNLDMPETECVDKVLAGSILSEKCGKVDADACHSAPLYVHIKQLLEDYCEKPRLYLHHDITLAQLAAHLGTNRYYLSQYFAQLGLTYNAYINGLRIQYFKELYQKANAERRHCSAQQLAYESGFRSYSTFSSAFKQYVGKTVREWIRDEIN